MRIACAIDFSVFMNSQPDPIRFLPNEPLPPYSYVPGKFPHPIRDEEGHSYGKAERPVPRPESAAWRDSEAYLRGLDLFNAGYYWEAHEAWEQVWHACGRKGRDADLFKGLIKLAAAGVKHKEGNSLGAKRHARRAAELLSGVAKGELDSQKDQQTAHCAKPNQHFGLNLSEVVQYAEAIANGGQAFDQPAIVLLPTD